jgi:hypothetical protein
MSMETQVALPASVAIAFETLDRDEHRSRLINRFARILLGNLTLGSDNQTLPISRVFACVTFIHLIEREHLKQRIKDAMEYHQANRKGERWKRTFEIKEIAIVATRTTLELQVVLATPPAP